MLTRGGPDVLQQAILLRKPIQGVVALAHWPNETAQRIGDILTSIAAGLVNLSNGDLNGRVILGFDDAVGGTALTRNIAIRDPGQFGNEDSGRAVEVLTGRRVLLWVEIEVSYRATLFMGAVP